VTCNCTEKCEAGAVNTDCPVCKNDLNGCLGKVTEEPAPDRKSTRLNSSHVSISYAVFCLKKKNKDNHFIRVSLTSSYSNLLSYFLFLCRTSIFFIPCLSSLSSFSLYVPFFYYISILSLHDALPILSPATVRKNARRAR